MIFTVVRNLVSNAIKFTPEFGKIEIIASKKESLCEISVSDSGIGISKENAENLFKIDRHIIMNGTNNEKGTGLGLILSKEFVEINKGKIWLMSEPEKGSTFIFTLPAVI